VWPASKLDVARPTSPPSPYGDHVVVLQESQFVATPGLSPRKAHCPPPGPTSRFDAGWNLCLEPFFVERGRPRAYPSPPSFGAVPNGSVSRRLNARIETTADHRSVGRDASCSGVDGACSCVAREILLQPCHSGSGAIGHLRVAFTDEVHRSRLTPLHRPLCARPPAVARQAGADHDRRRSRAHGKFVADTASAPSGRGSGSRRDARRSRLVLCPAEAMSSFVVRRQVLARIPIVVKLNIPAGRGEPCPRQAPRGTGAFDRP